MAACHLYKAIVTALGSDEDNALGSISQPIDAIVLAVHGWAALNGASLGSGCQTLSSGWKQNSPNFYEFQYTLASGTKVDVTVSRLGGNSAVVSAESEKNGAATSRLDISKYINLSFFQRPDGSEEIQDVYSSDKSVEAMCKQLDKDLSKQFEVGDELASSAESSDQQKSRSTSEASRSRESGQSLRESGLREPGTSNYSQASTPKTPESRPFTPELTPGYPSAYSLRADRGSNRRPNDPDGPPGFEDEYEMGQDTGFAGPGVPPGRSRGGPFGPQIGDSDLYPPGLGPNPPMAPFLGPGRVGGGRGGGMHPSMDDPLFRGGGGFGSRGDDDLRRPPGGRWDPPGPGSGRGFGGGGGFGDFI
uniref:ARAD1C07216p n=1 Tax=Blastobotrys adeninivorans TaxID=409370 RepID=A0A060T4Z5_BLAAD